ncbi:MAG TPA: methyltransferase domain-containing protein [Blastocatellia bacterium]|nr:methyltransferase domain-containing protein [Blastocatellia bacterium]
MHTSEKIFNPDLAQRLEDPERKTWMPPDEIIAPLRLQPGMHVADVGAGTGYFSLPLSVAVGPEGHVYAIDPVVEMRAILAGKLTASDAPQNISVQEGLAEQLPLDDDSCDAVFLANVWHGVEDREAALRECERVLRVPGHVLILDWHHDRERPPGPPLERRIPATQVVTFFQQHGWMVTEQRDIGPNHYLLLARPTQS